MTIDNDTGLWRYLSWNQGPFGASQHYKIARGEVKNYSSYVPPVNITKNWPSGKVAPNGVKKEDITSLYNTDPKRLAEGFIGVWRIYYAEKLQRAKSQIGGGKNRTGLEIKTIKEAMMAHATSELDGESLITFGIIENGLNTDSALSRSDGGYVNEGYRGMFQMSKNRSYPYASFLDKHIGAKITRTERVKVKGSKPPIYQNVTTTWQEYGRENISAYIKDAVPLITNNFNEFKKYVPNFRSTPLPPVKPKPEPGQTEGFAPPPVFDTAPVTGTVATSEPIAQDKKVDDTPDPPSKQPTGPITQIKRLFKPTIRPIDIELDMEAESLQNKKIIASTIGYTPLIFYNGVDIKATDVSSFRLYHEGMMPKIDCVIQDTYGVFKKTGMPGDDTKISIFMSSRSRILASIRLDFKVLEFIEISPGKYRVSAIIDIPKMYVRKYTNFSDKTSLEALQELAKELGLGFCTNINNTNDKQNWINTGNTQRHFMSDITEYSYISDTSFQVCYVDYYYNLCFVDISREYERDVSEDVGVSCVGFDTVTGADKKNDDKIESLVLTNERNLSLSSGFIEKYKVTNNSTTLSLRNAYRSDVKYLDIQKKEILYFSVDSQSGDPSKSQVLKATSGDEEFFKENTKSVYGGKIDTNEDGSGNVHGNSTYTAVNNRRNLQDFAKINSVMYLPNCNMNLYPYRKVKVHIMSPKQTPDDDSLISTRLTGDWLISGIEFSLSQGKFVQVLTCLKRELSLTKEEQDSQPPNRNQDQNNFKTSPNDVPILPNSVYKVGEIYTVKDVKGLEYKMTVEAVSTDGKEITASVDTRKNTK